jgi:Phycobilisome degradation protein nblA
MLTIEQSFQLKVFSDQIKNLNNDQAQELLLTLFEEMMIKDNLYKQIFKEDLTKR